MAVIDPTTDLGKVRLRIADVSDLPFLPDVVITQTISDCNGNLKQAALTCAKYILGMLSFKTHRKMAQLEVWGSDAFSQYRDFLVMTTRDPAFMDISPLPYGAGTETTHPLLEFQKSWNQNYYSGTQSQNLSFDASISPNDGSTFGPFGVHSNG